MLEYELAQLADCALGFNPRFEVKLTYNDNKVQVATFDKTESTWTKHEWILTERWRLALLLKLDRRKKRK